MGYMWWLCAVSKTKRQTHTKNTNNDHYTASRQNNQNAEQNINLVKAKSASKLVIDAHTYVHGILMHSTMQRTVVAAVKPQHRIE